MNRLSSLARLAVRPLLACALVAGGFVASAGLAHGPALQMLDRLQPGMWEMRLRDGGPAKRMCLANGRPLIQIRHPGAACQMHVVDDGADSVTVNYTCPGAGYGRTTVRLETPTLAQLETQGIASGTPFDFTAEVRRVGACTG